MDPEVPLRLRAYPTADPKGVPKARSDWPRTAVVCMMCLDREGAMMIGVLLEIFDRWVVTEQLVHVGTEPPADLVAYVQSHRAHTMAGASREIALVPATTNKIGDHWDGLGYRLRDRGYRRGWPLVFAGMATQLIGIADHWVPARKVPGAWSISLLGLGRWSESEGEPRYVKHTDAPRIMVEPIGQFVIARWGSTKKKETSGDDVGPTKRPPPRVGSFVDVFQAAGALRGQAVHDLEDACNRFGIDPPAPAEDPISRLRNEALAIAQLYVAEVAEVQRMDLGLDLSSLVSTGGIGTALLREAGIGR